MYGLEGKYGNVNNFLRYIHEVNECSKVSIPHDSATPLCGLDVSSGNGNKVHMYIQYTVMAPKGAFSIKHYCKEFNCGNGNDPMRYISHNTIVWKAVQY